ncbi:glycosyltransferase [Pseudobacter ginsenosidimutans]|nr:glycosyltransferase [Pseudobacter ginsenosidimutans]
MMIRIKKEHRWLKNFLSAHRVDAIISDNRFGLYAEHIPSVFITHQLAIKTGLGPWFDSRARSMNYNHINRFSEVWVPDNPHGYSIAGELAKPAMMPVPPVKYIGGISRFEKCDPVEMQAGDLITHPVDLLIILSGPEPQRSIFEQKLLEQLPAFNGGAVLVRALPGKHSKGEKLLPNLTSFDHLPAPALNRLVCKAKLVISRSGYTTVMDLLKTKKRSILVPTPGQAEQEYLASHLEKERLACSFTQEEFNLQAALQRASVFPFQTIDDDMQLYKTVINNFVQSLRS